MKRAARGLLVFGTAAAVVGLSKIHAAWIADPPYDYTGSSRFGWSLAFISLLALAAYGVGLPDLARGARSAFVWSIAAPAGGALAISVVQLAVGDALLPRFVVFGTAAVLVPWYALCAGLAMGGRSRAERRDSVVVVAKAHALTALLDDLGREPERHAQIVGHLTPEEAHPTGPRDRPLVERVTAERASVVVLDVVAQADESVVAQAAALHEKGIRIRTLSLFYEEWLGKLPVGELERVSLMFDIGELHRARYGRIKRMIDLAAGTVGCLILVLAVPFVLLGNLVGNRGPLLYRQERVGRYGRSFGILKFRTMRPAGETLVNEWTKESDLRITSFGRLLRRTHLDELPQVLNIVRGELSLVGPRPEQPHYVRELKEKIPFYDLRHLVRPGLTGWAQVKYGYAGSESDALEKLQYEFFYLRRQGLAVDFRVVGRTIRSVIGRQGR